MKKALKKFCLLVFLILVIFAVLCGCSSKKTFAKDGLSVTLTDDFYEREHIEYTAYYSSPEMVVLTLKENFSLFDAINRDAEKMTVKDYAWVVIGAYDSQFTIERKVEEKDGFAYFTYENKWKDKAYKFLWCGYKATNAFWSVQFGCKKSDFNDLKEDMFDYAKTVKVEQFVEKLSFSKIKGKDEYQLTGIGNLQSKEIVIPSEYEGLPVTEIGSRAFYSCKDITSVVMPDSITSIQNEAFSYCEKLEKITLSNNLTAIGDNAFAHCKKLKQITIPDSVVSLGKRVFQSCSNLTKVVLPKGLTAIPNSLCINCTLLREINISDQITIFGNNAFMNCVSLETINVPNGLQSIKENAFSGCTKLRGVFLPSGLTELGERAFSGCEKLTEMAIPQNITSIGEYTFKDCRNLVSIVLPRDITTIARNAFENCEKLEKVYYAGSLRNWDKIENNPFTTKTVYYYSEQQPNVDGYYWYYADGVPTEW